jgi:ABC-type bacteriocin/lantibiotic exporter with double-glycine peptidase domain
MKIPVMIQMQNNENGATALCMILGYHRRFVPIEDMREICLSSRNGSSPQQIADAAAHYGLDAKIENVSAEELRNMEFPVMIRWRKRYYALIKSIRGQIVTVVDPAGGEYKLEVSKLEEIFTGTVISFTKNASFKPGGKKENLIQLIRQRMDPIMPQLRRVLIFTVLCVFINLQMMKARMTNDLSLRLSKSRNY